MVETKHSLPNQKRGLATHLTRLYRYLRPFALISGKGGRPYRSIAAILLVTLCGTSTARGEVDALAVQRAIDRGVAYLRKEQNVRGGWKEFGGQSCGLSSLCTLALLNCGVEKDDPTIVNAMRYLRSFEPKETYSVALQTLAFCHLGAARDSRQIRDNVAWLVSHQKQAGNRIGSWDYGNNRGSGDPSNTQFALLALGAARDRGIEIDSAVFERSLEYWTARQRAGGWSYHGGQLASGSMTCAGIASIIIARSGLESGSSKIVNDNILCCGGDTGDQDPVEAGLQWLGRNFSLDSNRGGSDMTYYYYLYAVERVGRLSGRRFIGGHDWYREGAEILLKQQDGFRGFWSGKGQLAEANPDVATSFALLFLSKGKRQVVVGKLLYDDAPGRKGTQWNQHPDGLRQLVRHVERDWGRDLTWQTIDGNSAELVDLMQTPVLLISGHEALRFAEAQSERLKQYVDQGGCILFEADGGDGCGNAAGFQASVQQLTQLWYPGTKLERLPPSHPIWFAQREADPTALGNDFWVYGVQACCRTAIFYVPKSLSCRWQLGDMLLRRSDETPAARKQVDTAIRLGENLIAYATGRELKDKLDRRVVIDATELADPSRGAIRIAMLGLDAGGNEARRALPNATAIIGKRVPIQFTAAPDPVGFDAKKLRDLPLLWLHGRTDFELSESQREQLREYLRNDGMIIGTAICGNEPFADAFRREMALILPDAPLRAMPPNHPALTNSFGGFDISSVTIRKPADANGGEGLTRRSGTPVIETALLNGMTNVFFSPLDLSCALESQNSVQCPGYDTDDAAKIVANLVLFALQQ